VHSTGQQRYEGDKTADLQTHSSLFQIQMSWKFAKPHFLVGRKFEDRKNIFTVKSPQSPEKRPVVSAIAPWHTCRAEIVEKLPCQGEFSYTPLYWEWLEDVLIRCKDLLVANHLFDALYASLFIYDKCPNIVRAICEYWCPETNSLHTSKGEVSISLLDIYGFLGLPLSGFLYDEVVPPSKELKSSMGRSCTHLFKAYHILRQRFDHKPTIEEGIAFWFRGPIKYYAPTKSDRRSRVPLPNIISSATEVHG